MKARAVVLATLAVLLVAGLTACGGSSKEFGAGVRTSGRQVKALESELLRPHRYTLKQVKAAFATQGIRLRRMRSQRGGVVVLFDPRWSAPSGYHYPGKQPSATYFMVFVHAKGLSSGVVSDGNVWVANGPDEGRIVDAAFHKLDQRSKH